MSENAPDYKCISCGWEGFKRVRKEEPVWPEKPGD